MKQTREWDQIQAQMRPGVITHEGFLGRDTRNLVDILMEDDATVHRLGVTHRAIAARMKQLRDAGAKGLGLRTRVAPCFDVTVEGVRGKLPSPFGGPGLYGKTTTIVRNTELDEEIMYSDLHLHFVADHGFYEGKGSLYRLDPAKVVRVLRVDATDEIPEVPLAAAE